MAYPELVRYATEPEYRQHYERVYCRGTIGCFDGIEVRFQKRQFDHCFYESSKRDGVKDLFSTKRAERIDWIKAALQDGLAELYQGWDSRRRKHDLGRRVALVMVDYVVIIRITGPSRASFVTAYVADTPRTLAKIKGGPRWTPPGA